MPPKAKKEAEKKAALKGDEAQDLVLDYIRTQNRPYSAVDGTLNLKSQT